MLVGRGIGLILISRALGNVNFGIYALLLATYSIMLSVGAFGIEQTNLYLAGRRASRIPTLVMSSLLVGAVLGTFSAATLVALVHFLRDPIFTGAPTSAIVLTAMALPFATTHNGLIGVVLGAGHFRYYAVVESLKWGAYASAVVVMALRDQLTVTSALASFFGVILLATLTHLIVLAPACARAKRIRLRVLTRILAMGRSMLMVQFTSVLTLRLDVYAVRLFGSMVLVGSYALASQLCEILMHIGRSFTLVVFSGTARGSSHTRLRVQSLVLWIVGAAALLALVFLVARHEILQVVFGATSSGSGPVLLLRMPGVLVAAITLLFVGELLGRGRSDLVIWGNLIGLVVLGVCILPLAQWNTVKGAAIAFTIAAVVEWTWVFTRLARERRTRRITVPEGSRRSSRSAEPQAAASTSPG